jgi:hypothetical protein
MACWFFKSSGKGAGRSCRLQGANAGKHGLAQAHPIRGIYADGVHAASACFGYRTSVAQGPRHDLYSQGQ